MLIDKKGYKKKWRISEQTLLSVSFIGGFRCLFSYDTLQTQN